MAYSRPYTPEMVGPKMPGIGQPSGPAKPPGGGPGGWEWINGQWGRNLPAGGTALPQPAAPAPEPAAGGNVAEITTPYKPQNIYSPNQTQVAVNQAVAQNTPDAYEAMKQAGNRKGISRGGTEAAEAGAIMTGQRAAGNQAGAEIPLLDYIANQRHMMAGEQGSSQFGFDAAGLLNRLQQTRDKQYLGNQGNQLSLLGQLMGQI